MREIETVEDLAAAAATSRAGGGSMAGWQVQGVDLSGHEDELDGLDPRGALFLGVAMDTATEDRLRDGGALVFPTLPELPFDPWRAGLYTSAELYADLDDGYAATPDARTYVWARRHAPEGHPGEMADLLARAVHDSSVDDALEEHLQGRRVVGIMGGHALRRDEEAYAEAARLAHDLAGRGLTVATGGGPGAMEAANLGARLAGQEPEVLERVLTRIARVPAYDDVTAWARAGLDAVADLEDSGLSLGIPTWHYGHEPPNPFASRIAKYFRNAIREDVLLEVCRGGLVFLPGAAGTVQEVFQAACTGYYAQAEDVAPLVLVGEEHWTRTLPAWPLLAALAEGRPLGARVALVAGPAEVAGALVEQT